MRAKTRVFHGYRGGSRQGPFSAKTLISRRVGTKKTKIVVIRDIPALFFHGSPEKRWV